MKKQRALGPLRTVVRSYVSSGCLGLLMEDLECGHTIEVKRDIKSRPRKAVRRRCWKCQEGRPCP